MFGFGWKVGDWAFAYFEDDGYWYPAEVTAVDGKEITVRYDYDEEEETLDKKYLDDYKTHPGEEGAECYSEDDDVYYEVDIVKVNGEEILVRYEDDTEEWVDLSDLRFED
jgi:hypothetical protein